MAEMMDTSIDGLLRIKANINLWTEDVSRADQRPPTKDWMIWLLLGGRGAGKTRAGAEWVRGRVRSGARRVALVAPSYHEAREVMIEGESGLLNIGKADERPVYLSSRKRLQWPCGAIAQVFSAEEPNGLRGPQFDCAWADEFCAWSYPDAALSNLRLGLRLGEAPRLVITTTPRPIPALLKLIEEKGVSISRACTKDNEAHLSQAFIETVYETYGGTRLGRQELGGEILDDAPGALWSHALIDGLRSGTAPPLEKTVIAIDPPVTSGPRADSCGIIVAGRAGFGKDAKAFILHDGTLQGASPEGWALHALNLWEQWDADYILVEVNQGGEMVKSVFRAVGADVPLRTVYASKSKTARAEPIAALYEQGRVRHVGEFPELEDEMCLIGADILSRKSPDRADALVWAVTDLLLRQRVDPRIRCL